MKNSGLRTRGRSIIATLACSAMLAGVLIGAATPAGAGSAALVPQSIALVSDINPGTASSSPTTITAVGSTAFFRATDGTGVGGHGQELWKSDGSTAGTVLVKDINLGTANSAPANLTSFNGSLFFSATDGVNGTELWTSDGTEGGTVLLKDINTTSPTANSNPGNFRIVGSTLFFTADDGVTGVELWKTDGTAGGTVQVKDIRATGGSGPTNLANINGILYFAANDGVVGNELWTSDGTNGGTVLVRDINPTIGTGLSTNSNPSQFAHINGITYFTATNGATLNGTEPWTTDGTTAGTVMLADLNPGTGPSGAGPFMNVNGTVVFPGFITGAGTELLTTDGTTAGTVLLAEIVPGPTGGTIQNVTTANNLLYFMAVGTGLGQELWRSDGTAAGTFLTKDIVPGSGNGILTNFSNAALNGEFYFVGGGFGREIWKTDGTTAGTVLAAPGGNFPSGFVVVNGILLMQASNTPNGTELFRLNNGPTAVDDSYTTNEDTPLSVTAPGLLANDTDPDGNLNTLTAVKVTDPAHGTVTVNGDGSFTYTPAANYNGPDSFTYKANDGSLDSTPVTVNITVTAAADAPEAVDDTYSTPKDVPLTVTVPGVLGNDTDADGDTLTAGSASTPANGAVTLNADGSFTYTPNAGYAGPDSFTYVVSDGLGGTDSGTVSISVTVPTVSASPASVSAGDAVTATWANIASPTATDWVGLYESSSAADPALLAWSYTNGSASGNLNLTVPLNAAAGDNYELRLYSNNTYTRLATSAPFEVTASATTIAASPSSVAAGGLVTATWSGIAAPTAGDWVGLYDSASAPEPALLAWAYTGGSAAGNLNLTVPGGATPGSSYELRLFTNNTYTRLATSAPFEVTAANTTLSASPSSVNAGSPVTATWSGIPAPSPTDWIGIYDSSSAPDTAPLAWTFTDGNAAGNLNLTVPIGAASGSAYELRLFSNNSYTRLATSNAFSVTASNATLSSSHSSVANGNPLTATWSGIAAPSATDWVGLYDSSGAADSAIVAWAYTGGAANGSVNLTVPAGSPPGATYELRLFSNNTYTRLATSTPFTVT
jgi:ELWxxDGT repeat protein/VCBS repeat-containing protein